MADGSTIKAVIFDMGGVILRTGDGQPREDLARRFGLTRQALEAAVFDHPVAQAAESGQATVDDVWAAVGRSLGLPQAEVPALADQFFAGDAVDFELVRFIQSLRPRFTTALLSNTWVADMPTWLAEKWQIAETFDVVISSAYYQMAKPDPRIFRKALELVQAGPDETIFVDDFPRNIAAAEALGIRTVLFRSTAETVAMLQRDLGL